MVDPESSFGKTFSNTALVPTDSDAYGQIARLIDDLIGVLADVRKPTNDLRQLKLEAHWLKEDLQQGVLAVPTTWELLISQISRNTEPEMQRDYPQVVDAAKALSQCIEKQLKGRHS